MWYHTWDIPIQLISSSLRYSLTSTDSTHRESCSPNIQHRFHTLGIMLTKISSTDSTHWESCSPKYPAPIPHTRNHAHQNIQHRFHTLGIMLTKISSTDSTHWESCSPKYPAPIPHTGNHAHHFDPLSSPGSITKNVCQ